MAFHSSVKYNFKFFEAYFNKIEPARFFLFAAIIFQILYNLVTPPFQAPDEQNHFYRAYRIAEGSFLPQKINNRLGGEIPKNFNEFILPFKNASTNFEYTIDGKIISDAFKIKLSKETEFQDFPNTSYYSPVSYIPQAFAIFILKKMNCSFATIYYGGKLFVFIAWLLCVFFVIKTLPVYRWLFTALILLPMNLYITNSFSADTVTCILSFLFLNKVLRLTFINKKINYKDVTIILLIIGLLALAKIVYIGLVILLLIIPKQNFNNRMQRLMFLIGIFLFSVLVAFAWSDVVMNNYLSYTHYNTSYREISSLTKEADYYAQKNYIFNHGLYFFKVIFKSLFVHPQRYLVSFIGCFGTYLDLPLPYWLCIMAYLVLIFLALFETNRFYFLYRQKIVIFLSALATLILLLLSQHLTWDAVGAGIVELLQGRYLIPLMPLLFILFSNKVFSLKFNYTLFVIVFIIFINLFSIKIIYDRFIKKAYYQKIEFTCDVETVDNTGKFLTSNPAILLDNANCQTGAEHKSGKYSAVLTPQAQYCFGYKFNNLNYGDLVEIEAWKKGNAGNLVVAGKGNNCDDFYFSNNSIVVSYKDGWSKMSFVFTMKQNCNNSDATFFVWNSSPEKVYFDDIKFVLKKFKRK